MPSKTKISSGGIAIAPCNAIFHKSIPFVISYKPPCSLRSASFYNLQIKKRGNCCLLSNFEVSPNTHNPDNETTARALYRNDPCYITKKNTIERKH